MGLLCGLVPLFLALQTTTTLGPSGGWLKDAIYALFDVVLHYPTLPYITHTYASFPHAVLGWP